MVEKQFKTNTFKVFSRKLAIVSEELIGIAS